MDKHRSQLCERDWTPAYAGVTGCVIPAKAGIQSKRWVRLDPSLRWGDTIATSEYGCTQEQPVTLRKLW